MQPIERIAFFHDAERGFRETRNAFLRADRIYFVMSSEGIGDSVIATGYLHAIKQAVKQSGRAVPISVLVNDRTHDLFDPLVGVFNEVIKIDTAAEQGFIQAQDIASRREGDVSLLLDFQGAFPLVEANGLEDGNLFMLHNLFTPAVFGYKNSTDGNARYAHFVEDLFGLPQRLAPEFAQPYLPLPANSEDRYTAFLEQFAIDPQKPQIAIVTEASLDSKKYPLVDWSKVIEGIQSSNPEHQVSLVYNERMSSEEQLRIDIHGNNLRFVHGSLGDLAIFLSRQNLVLSNDTGLAHIAAAVESGPPVITLFIHATFKPDIWVSGRRQIPISTIDVEDAVSPVIKAARDTLIQT